jgi:hypothetical protein
VRFQALEIELQRRPDNQYRTRWERNEIKNEEFPETFGLKQLLKKGYRRELTSDANQLVEMALGSHNISFLYEATKTEDKCSTITMKNCQLLMKFIF